MESVAIFDLLTSPGTFVLGLAVFILTFFTRRIVELLVPWWKKQADANDPKKSYLTKGARWWNEVILYGVPVLYGCLLGLLDNKFLFGEVSGTAKILFGGGVGWFASFLYKALRKVIMNKTGIDPVPSPDSIQPDAPPGD